MKTLDRKSRKLGAVLLTLSLLCRAILGGPLVLQRTKAALSLRLSNRSVVLSQEASTSID